jgi:hypothetical protein
VDMFDVVLGVRRTGGSTGERVATSRGLLLPAVLVAALVSACSTTSPSTSCTTSAECSSPAECVYPIGDCSAKGQCIDVSSLLMCGMVVYSCGCGATVNALCGQPYAAGPSLYGPYQLDQSGPCFPDAGEPADANVPGD